MSKIIYWIAAAALAVPAAAFAQRGGDTAGTTSLGTVVVTANRLPTPRSSVTRPVTVISGDDLRARGVRTVAVALQEVPGAHVAQSGSYGSLTSLFLRGGESRYTKVLVDGVPINDVGGAAYLQHLTTDNIDRIEVLRGPGSALYGADALAGVVQIFTKRGAGRPQVEASARAGTIGTRDGDVAVRGGTNAVSYSFGAGARRTDGTLPFNNEYDNQTLSGAVTWSPDARSALALTSRYTTAEYHYPTDENGTPVDSNSYNVQQRLVVGLDASRAVLPWLTLRALGTNNDIRDVSRDLDVVGTGSSAVATRNATIDDGFRRGAELRAEAMAGRFGTLTVGTQYQKEHHTTATYPATTPPSPQPSNSRITRSAYGAFQGGAGSRVAYDASVRYDDQSDFRNLITYTAGVNVAVVRGLRLRASHGTGFNAPAFYQTQGSAFNAPNPSLRPEQTRTTDVALEQSLFGERVRASVGAFDQRFGQMIQYVAGTPARYDNVTASRSQGYESELHALLATGLTADLSYSQTIARVTKVPPGLSSPVPGTALLRRPSHSGTANLAYTLPGRGSLAAMATYVGKRPDTDFSTFPSPTVTLPSYVRLDLNASADVLHRAGRTVALTARVENATNKRYENVLHFPAPSRAFLFGARVAMIR